MPKLRINYPIYIFGWFIVRGVTLRRWYWFPKRLTMSHNPPIYRWGFWNFGPEEDSNA